MLPDGGDLTIGSGASLFGTAGADIIVDPAVQTALTCATVYIGNGLRAVASDIRFGNDDHRLCGGFFRNA